VCDRVLLLAATIAAQIDLAPIAAACREIILAHNPGHMVSRWPTITGALREEDFRSLINQLSTRYGPEHVERLVEQLGIERASERDAYADDGEYAAALLGLDWDELQRRFGSELDE
jgi:hypothetical protein